MPKASATSQAPLLSIRDAAKYLGVSDDTIRRMISRGELSAYRYGPKIIRIDRRDIDKLRRPVTATADYRAALAGGASA